MDLRADGLKAEEADLNVDMGGSAPWALQSDLDEARNILSSRLSDPIQPPNSDVRTSKFGG